MSAGTDGCPVREQGGIFPARFSLYFKTRFRAALPSGRFGEAAGQEVSDGKKNGEKKEAVQPPGQYKRFPVRAALDYRFYMLQHHTSAHISLLQFYGV